MKTKHFLFFGVVVIGIFLLWVLHRKQANQIVSSTPTQIQVATNIPGQQPIKQSADNPLRTVQPQNITPTNLAAKPHTAEEWMQQEYGHAIEFYGKVTSEDETPIAGATIGFDWVNWKGEGQHASAASDSLGLFSVADIRGKNLGVTVSKNGYYPRVSSFEYADPGRGLFTPDKNNPVVFHLRKKGPGVDLVTSQHGISSNLAFYAPTNGSPVFIDLLTRQIGASGQLEVESWKNPKDFTTGQNNWSLRLTIPNGGFVGENEEFPFEAPGTGYESIVEWHFTDGQPDWRGYLKTNFYIQFGNPPCFGRIAIETSAFQKAVFLEYAINPTGSRNLEPQ